MKISEIIKLRLHNQLLSDYRFSKPADVVKWFGAVQSQEFESAKWAVGQRVKNCTDEDVQDAFDKGEIVRTHIMRPTWHFVSPADLKWLMKLTASRVNAMSQLTYHQLELDDKIFKTSNRAIEKALQKGIPLDRKELRAVLQKKGINTDDIRMSYLLLRAELDLLICSGPKCNKQFTYVLVDRCIPESIDLSREESLAELTKRYFTAHGPATIKDYSWWSGLTMNDCRRGIEMLGDYLSCETIDAKKYFHSNSMNTAFTKNSGIYLLPPYDEYTVGYSDRSIILDNELIQRAGNGIFKPVIIKNGKIIGVWDRSAKEKKPIDKEIFKPVSKSDDEKIKLAAKRYAKFQIRA